MGSIEDTRRLLKLGMEVSQATIAKYMSPKGTSIHGQGLPPSVPVSQEDDDEAEDQAGSARPDRILEKALEVVKGEAAPAEKAAA